MVSMSTRRVLEECRASGDDDGRGCGDGERAFETPAEALTTTTTHADEDDEDDDEEDVVDGAFHTPAAVLGESGGSFDDDARELMYDEGGCADDEGSDARRGPAGFVMARLESLTTSVSEFGSRTKDFIATTTTTALSRGMNKDEEEAFTSTLDDMRAVLEEAAETLLMSSPTSTSTSPTSLVYTTPTPSTSLHTTPNTVAIARTEREQIDYQRGLCAGCASSEIRVGASLARRFVETALRPFRSYQRCDYTNEVFCDACAPATSFAIIPWRVLAHWDFRPRRVSASAATFLRSIETLECLKPSDANPSLFSTVPDLGKLRDARVRINAIYTALHAKDPDVAERLKSARLKSSRADARKTEHFFADAETFSMSTLRALHRAPDDIHARGRALERHLRTLLAAHATARR